MKRLHVSLGATDLDRSVAFYSELFAAAPTVLTDDYAKWQLDDPRVNFSLTARGGAAGFDHLGIEAEDAGELGQVIERLDAAEGPVLGRGEAACCYARSDKAWIRDPDGVAWEAFHTTARSDSFGAAPNLAAPQEAKACCAND